MFDLPMGFHQLAVALASCKKLAFQGVDGIKWTYTVMPFGPTNGPATVINFIHDLNSVWKEHARSSGIPIDDDTNTKIIVDDIISWLRLLEYAIAYMRCQLKVCQAYHLSLTLRKSHFFQNALNLLVLTCAMTAIALHSQSSCSLRHGQLQNLSKTLRNLLALLSSTPGSFLISRCAQPLYAL